MSEQDEVYVDEVTELEPDEPDADEDDPSEDDEPDELEQEPEPEQDDALDTEAQAAEIGKKLDGLGKHVAKRMGDILGDDAALYAPCPACTPWQTPGWVPPVDPPPDVQAALLHYMGQRAASDLLPDPHSERCPECNGEGANEMPTNVAEQKVATCVKCSGKGWLALDAARGGAPSVATNGPAPTYPPPSAVASALPDLPVEDDPRVTELRQMGYAVIPPMTVAG
jgi:hypothetical protein